MGDRDGVEDGLSEIVCTSVGCGDTRIEFGAELGFGVMSDTELGNGVVPAIGLVDGKSSSEVDGEDEGEVGISSQYEIT